MPRDQGRDLLAQDDVPDENQSLTCFSCHTAMVGLYCHACGNKNDNFRRSVFALGLDLFQNVTAVDGRIWRSLWSLVRRPGRMAREYADGARTRWTSPVRMFLVTSLLLFGYIALSGTQIVALGQLKDAPSGAASAPISFSADDGIDGDGIHFFVQKSRLADTVNTPKGTPLRPGRQSEGHASSYVEGFLEGLRSTDRDTVVDLRLDQLDRQIESAATPDAREASQRLKSGLEAVRDAYVDGEVDAESVEAEYGLNTERRVGINFPNGEGQNVTLDGDGLAEIYDRLLRRPEIVNDSLNENLKLAMFYMVPLSMLLGAMFIRGRERAMLYDHAVHAAYVHSFSFLLLFVFLVLHQYTPVPLLLLVYTGALLVWLPVSTKRMFKRGWFKTVLTAYGVGALYSCVIFVSMGAMVLSSLQSVALQVEATRPAIDASQSPASPPINSADPSLPSADTDDEAGPDAGDPLP